DTETPGEEEVHRSERSAGPLHLEVAFGDASFTAEGDAQMVLQAFESFKAHDAAHHRQRTPTKPPSQPAADQAEPEDQEQQKTETLPLPVFLKQFELKTNYEKALAIAVWASHQPN